MQSVSSVISDSLETVCWLTAHLLVAALTAACVVTHGKKKCFPSAGLCASSPWVSHTPTYATSQWTGAAISCKTKV